MLIARHIAAVFLGLLAFGLVASGLTGCSDEDDLSRQAVHSLSGATMGTVYTVKVVAPQAADLATLKADIQSVLDRIESRMSTYRSDSELSRFNRAEAGGWFEVSDETAKVVALGLEISDLTQGAFDMTVAPLVDLWGFGPGNAISKAPSEQLIQDMLSRIGFRHIRVQLQPAALSKQQQASLDLSAIAKGYAVDQVAQLIGGQYPAFLVEVGGELRAQGLKPDGSNWRIAVETPLPGVRSVQKVLKLENTAIATSGDYRNYFEQDGIRYSHTIDPVTGKPIRHRLASVTVLDPSCGRADALATAMMVLGEEKGLALAKQLKLPAFFVIKQDDGFVEAYTPEFEAFLLQ